MALITKVEPLSKNGSNKKSLSLWGVVAMGTGVMIGAGIFALTGEIAAYARDYMIWAFLAAGLVAGLTSYTYVKMVNAYPSSGGIAMILEKAYGKTTITAWGALLMYFSMVVNESLVARTFGNYLIQIEGIGLSSGAIPWLGAGLVIISFLVNILNNSWIQNFSLVTAVIKAVGLAVLALGGLYASGISFPAFSGDVQTPGPMNFLGAVAIAVLAFKGFTTITNSGGEIKEPHKNVGRAIVISIGISMFVYFLVTLAVGSSLSLDEILKARNYSLAEAARPSYGQLGVTIMVAVAIIATVSGIIASMFAVSRMLAMLTDMKLVPHRHFGMPGSIQKHVLVYTAVLALVLTVTFDVSRIAVLGAIFYIIMDFLIHFGVHQNLKSDDKVKANPLILKTAMLVDAVIFVGLIYMKVIDDPMILGIAIVFGLIIWFYEKHFLREQLKN